jgi:predicted RNA-binding protein
MCIATIYVNDKDANESVMQDVVQMIVDNGYISCKDILGEEKRFDATLKSVDFVKHHVVIEMHGK